MVTGLRRYDAYLSKQTNSKLRHYQSFRRGRGCGLDTGLRQYDDGFVE